MMTRSFSSTTAKLRTRKATLALVGFVFVFLVASLAIGLRTSSATIPWFAGAGCTGSEDGPATCTSSSMSTVTSGTVTTTATTSSSSTETTVATTTTTETSTSGSQSGGVNDPAPTEGKADCSALNGIAYSALAPGTNVTIAFNGNGQMTYTVPKTSFSWNWYFVPADGQSTSTLGQEVTTALWSSGHGQNFSFFVAKLNGQIGLVLQTDYALSQVCS